MSVILGKWNLTSSSLTLSVTPQATLHAILWKDNHPHKVEITGLPCIAYEKLVKVPFQQCFYPSISRLDNGNFKVQFHVRGLGGGFWDWICCRLPAEDKQPLQKPLLDPSSSSSSAVVTVTKSENSYKLPNNAKELVHALASAKGEQRQSLLRVAIEMVRQFAKAELSPRLVKELVMLVNANSPELTRSVVEKLIHLIRDSVILSPFLIYGLGTAIEEAPFTHLRADDLVQILEVLTQKLGKMHLNDTLKTAQQLQAIARVLNAMSDSEVSQLSRINVHQSTYDLLHKISQCDNLELYIWANYAKQSLVRISDDESMVKLAIRKAKQAGLVICNLAAAIKNLNPNYLVSAYSNLKELYAHQDRKQMWHDQIRICEWFIGQNAFDQLEQHLVSGVDTFNPLFIFPLIYRLDQYIQTHSDPQMQRRAFQILANLFFKPPLPENNFLGRNYRTCLKEHLIGLFLAYQHLSSLSSEVSKFWPLIAQDPAFKPEIQPLPLAASESAGSSQASLFTVATSKQVPLEVQLKAIQTTLTENAQFVEDSQFYVPVFGTQGAGPFDLRTAVMNFLQGNQRVLLLLGNAGSGKSFFCQMLATELWSTYQMGGTIPLFISLPSLRDPLKNAIPETLQEFGFDLAKIDELRRTRQFVFILDGYDEINQLQNLYATNQLHRWNCKVIISCRSQYLTSMPNYLDYFMPYEQGKAQKELFLETHVAPFSRNQKSLFLQKYVPHVQSSWHDSKTYEEQIEKIPGLSELTENPFTLKITSEVLPDIVIKHQNERPNEVLQLTQLDLYDAFKNHWFERQKIKLIASGQQISTRTLIGDMDAFCKEFAKKLTLKGLTQVTYIEQSELFEQQPNEWDSLLGNKNPRIVTARSGAPIRTFGPNQIGFYHDTLRSYFYSRTILS